MLKTAAGEIVGDVVERLDGDHRRGEAGPPRDAYAIKEVAKRLGIGLNQAYDACHRGEIPTIRIGGRLLVPRAAFERMLDPKAT